MCHWSAGCGHTPTSPTKGWQSPSINEHLCFRRNAGLWRILFPKLTVRYSFRTQAFRRDVKYEIYATLIHCKNSQTSTPGSRGHQCDLRSQLSDHKMVLPIKPSHSLTLLLASTPGFQRRWGMVRHLSSNMRCLKENKNLLHHWLLTD